MKHFPCEYWALIGQMETECFVFCDVFPSSPVKELWFSFLAKEMSCEACTSAHFTENQPVNTLVRFKGQFP